MNADYEPEDPGNEEADDAKTRRRRWTLEFITKVTGLIVAIGALVGACNGNGPTGSFG